MVNKMDYKASMNAPDPVVPSQIPDVRIDYRGLENMRIPLEKRSATCQMPKKKLSYRAVQWKKSGRKLRSIDGKKGIAYGST